MDYLRRTECSSSSILESLSSDEKSIRKSSEDYEKKGKDSYLSSVITLTSEPGTPATDEGSSEIRSIPDGGLDAWMTVMGAFFGLFGSFGWINAMGVFQKYYETHQLSTLSESTISWISSLQIFFLLFSGLFIGHLFDSFGPRYLILFGTSLQVFGIMMTSISHTYYQILICQAIIAPIGSAFTFHACLLSSSTWFDRKRAMVIGIVISGSSVGGLVFPIVIRHFLDVTTYGWTMRICGFIIFSLLLVANVTVKSDNKPSGWRPLNWSTIYKTFNNFNFIVLTTASFFVFLAVFSPFAYVVSDAVYHGVDATKANYLVSVLNGSSIFGRIIPGLLADKFGRYNMYLIGIFLCGILTLALWIPAQSFLLIAVYASIYGFFSGTVVTLLPSCCSQISDIKQIGTSVGTIFGVIGFACLSGIPICGAIIQDGTKQLQWTSMKFFCGMMILCGGLILVFARLKLAHMKILAKL
ncbi:major facilitator superfamily domain-containing protein [Lipomyces kononenkoae]|uniref:Major facilitator superfamily domain-containing protein n=1 Tax=Lipomyces kononenkoae TaxID=34357 RepID=A0ACC3T481_LIPKO